MKIKPLGNRVLVKGLTDEAKKHGVQGVDKKEKDRPSIGEVVAVSEDYDGRVKEGQKVFFQRFGSEEVEWNKETVYAVLKEDLVAILK